MTTHTFHINATNEGLLYTIALNPDKPLMLPDTNGWIRHDDGTYTNDPIWTETETLFQDALKWAALCAAQVVYTPSDSHVDDQYCLARFISQMTDIVYGYDQTEQLNGAIQRWLDDADAVDDLIYCAKLLNFIPSHGTTTPLFDYFVFTEIDD